MPNILLSKSVSARGLRCLTKKALSIAAFDAIRSSLEVRDQQDSLQNSRKRKQTSEAGEAARRARELKRARVLSDYILGRPQLDKVIDIMTKPDPNPMETEDVDGAGMDTTDM